MICSGANSAAATLIIGFRKPNNANPHFRSIFRHPVICVHRMVEYRKEWIAHSLPLGMKLVHGSEAGERNDEWNFTL